MKALILPVLVMAAFAGAAQAADSGWRNLPEAGGKGGSVYMLDEPIDLAAWPRVQVWTRFEFKTPLDPDKPRSDGGGTRSALSIDDYDCTRKTTRALGMVFYDHPDLEGDPTTWAFEQEDDPAWTMPGPGSVLMATLGAVCAAAVPDGGTAADSASEPETADEVLAAFKAEGVLFTPYVLIHDLFPTEWDVFADRFLNLSRTDQASLPDFMSGFLSDLVGGRERFLEAAPPESLRAIAAAKARLLILLKARRVQSCATYAMYDRITLDDDPTGGLSQALAEVWNTQLQAIRRGMDHPVQYRAIGDTDSERFGRLFLTKGGEAEQWAAIYGGKTEALSPEAQCQAWTAFMRTLAAAPEPTAGRVASWFFGPTEGSDKPSPDDAPVDRTAS